MVGVAAGAKGTQVPLLLSRGRERPVLRPNEGGPFKHVRTGRPPHPYR
jgi:hypothetical protein